MTGPRPSLAEDSERVIEHAVGIARHPVRVTLAMVTPEQPFTSSRVSSAKLNRPSPLPPPKLSIRNTPGAQIARMLGTTPTAARQRYFTGPACLDHCAGPTGG